LPLAFGAILTSLLVALMLAGAAAAQGPSAPYGEVARFGGYDSTGGKTTLGKFVYPVGFAVAPGEGNSVYVLDRVVNQEPAGTTPGKLGYRLQKLSSTGASEGSVVLPVEEYAEGAVFSLSEAQPLISLAVDSEKKRVYALVEAIVNSGEFRYVPVAERLVAWSTEPKKNPVTKEEELVPAEGYVKKDSVTGAALVAEIPTAEASKDLYDPTGIVVDPKTHDVVIEAQESVSEAHGGPAALQRVNTETPDGKLGEKWEAETNITPDGLFNVKNGSEESFGVKLYKGYGAISPIANVKAISGKGEPSLIVPDGSGGFNFDEALSIDNETTINRNEEFNSHLILEPPTAGSPVTQLSDGIYAARYGNLGGNLTDGQALAPWNAQGSLPYFWTQGTPEHNNVGNMGIRLFKEGPEGENIITTIGGPSVSSCHVDFAQLSVAAGSGGALFVLLQPNQHNGNSDDEVIEFAPGGTGACPVPGGEVEVNGAKVSSVTVAEGEPVQFDASSIERQGETPFEFDWNFEGKEFVVGSKIDEERKYMWASPIAHHTYPTKGEYNASVRLVGDYGTSVVNVKVKVGPAMLPVARFVAPSSVTAGQTVTFDASESTPSTGYQIVKYQWNFGEGASSSRGEPKVEHAFASPGTYEVKLTITDKAEKTAEVTHAVVVVASGEEKHEEPKHEESSAPKEEKPPTGGTGPSPGPSPVSGQTPPSGVKGSTARTLTTAQKLTKALRACRKVKPKKRRVSCEKLARKRYAPKKGKRGKGRKGHR
jgi:PKD repeat protein